METFSKEQAYDELVRFICDRTIGVDLRILRRIIQEQQERLLTQKVLLYEDNNIRFYDS